MTISVVIPTCDRKSRLLALLGCLAHSLYPIHEVIIVDSGEDRLSPNEILGFQPLNVQYLSAEKSVCVQRNTGIRRATGDWIFLCDDDIEMPADYLQLLMAHVAQHAEAGAVSGLVLQKEKEGWQAKYPVRSASGLLRAFIFQLSIWGEIECPDSNILIRKIKDYYNRKGNHLSKAGWPVITAFSGDYFVTPVYGLGASVIKRDWLLASPYDEVLDRHGIGDNYGVAMGLPATGIQVLNKAFVYHHQEQDNRLIRPLQFFRRMMALDYFLRTRPQLKSYKRRWLLWSLTGTLLNHWRPGDKAMRRAILRCMKTIIWGPNPYDQAARNKQRILEPLL